MARWRASGERAHLAVMLCCALWLGLLAWVDGAAAQSAGKQALRAEQAAAFDRMLAAPDDLELMFAYALISLELEDLEAAITTFERMLIYDENLPRVQLELGAAYFRLGSYAVARYYFDLVRASENVPPEVLERVALFDEQITRRTRTSVLSGEVSVGLAFASNANLGPQDAEVLLFGIPATLRDRFTANPDGGLRAVGSLSHIYDLERPNGDAWRTDLTGLTLRYAHEADGDVDLLSIVTGPSLAADDEQFGLKLRPTIGAELVRSANATLYRAGSVGLEAQETFGSELAAFGRVAVGYRDYSSGNDSFDGGFADMTAGVAWSVAANSAVRLTAFAGGEDTASPSNSNVELGGRIGAFHAYDPGLGGDTRRWTISGYAQLGYRAYEEPSDTVDPDRARRDVELRLGAGNTFDLGDGLLARLEVDYLRRMSNLPNFDLSNIGVTTSLGYRF